LAALLLTLVGLGSRALKVDIAGAVVTLVLSGLAVAVLVKLFQLQPGPLTAAPAPALEPAPEVSVPELEPGPPDPRLQPTWQPDSAAGAAWLTAKDAAAGAPATGWGTPGEPAGWQPAPAPETRPTPPPTTDPGDDRVGTKKDDPTPHWWSDQA
jgi:hypothetical protein